MNSSRLTIAHVADYVMPSMGYQEFMLAKWNARHGQQVHMLTGDRYTPVPDYETSWRQILGPRIVGEGVNEIDGVVVHRLPVRMEVGRKIWLSGLSAEIRRLSPDIVLCHGTSSPSAFVLPKVCKRLGVPLLMDNHMAFVAKRTGIAGRLGYVLLRFMTRRTMNGNVSGFLGVGQESCDFLIREQGVPPDKVGHLAIGVDTEMFRPDLQARNRARKAYGIPLEAKVVMQTGKLSPDKSPEWLAEAAAPIMEHRPDVWLVFVGGGAAHELEMIQAPIERAGVSDRMKVLAAVAVPKLADMFNMADICVYPNGSSLSCMEAAASGRPVIVTDLPWGLERQRAGVTVCYQTGNIDDLRGKIRWLLSDLDARDGIGRRARQAVMENFSYDKIAHRSEDMMREAIASYSFA